MSYSLAASQAIISKAGSGVNPDAAASHALVGRWSNMAEHTFCSLTRRDWLTNTAGDAASGAIEDAVSDLAAMKLISYDMSGYTSRAEAQTMLDVLTDNARRIIDFLKEDENQVLNK